MAASRRGQPELHVRLPSSPSVVALPDLPPISALFLIDFDVKAGYTISWKASKPHVELEGVVEYKSLPSGLHTVSEDLIYFVHDGYAGLSAFVNAPVEDTAARNARMLAVGVLVPLSYGRLGRAWKHAESLKAIASKLVVDSKDVSILEEYWEKNQARDPTDSVDDGAAAKESPGSPTMTLKDAKAPRGHARKRSASDGTALMLPGHRLSPFHPAWSLTKLLDTFGPLIFPIHRAALLRKRILISGHAPVEQVCNFVYNISVLSNIPLATANLLSSSSASHRLRPLFSIGVHDIPFLTEDAKHYKNMDAASSSGSKSDVGTGWIACTTDSILSKKDVLWDMLITMPPPHAANAKKHIWPTVELPHGVFVKGTQRDMRRFRSLKLGIARMEGNVELATPTTPRTVAAYNEESALLDEAEQVVEPTSWAALAYSGFMWWASAGEKARADEAEESAQDASLLSDSASSAISMNMPRTADIADSVVSLAPRRSSIPSSAPPELDEARAELAIIAYFHRLTTQLIGALVDAIDQAGDSGTDDEGPAEGDDGDALLHADGEDAPGRSVQVDTDVLKSMGLDIWNLSDAEFVKDLLKTYFDRQAYIEGKGVEVCGIRVC
ncbi:putative duf2347 superfamily protein [Rosellinia necatrix]|uniref:Putative duf2347 superfamily protein n=1 Tax=Rosellinia necatrix TaxID=77044 RepID=A0A1W2THZ5_ROSNE|nr:putative duf2347 superfamily protein [Rosellinia necatrix]